MEVFQVTLDELQRESKEKIVHAQDAASAAVLQGHVVPHRIAVAMAQRFTSDRVESCFPVLCLLDATLVRTSSASPSTASEVDQALAAVLAEFWTLAPSAFTSVYGAGQPVWRDKCLRLVRRWKQRQLVPEPLITDLLTAMETGRVMTKKVDAPSAASVSGSATNAAVSSSTPPSADAAPAASSGQASTSSAVTATTTTAASLPTSHAESTSSFTAAQARAFQSTLQSCLSALESLQPARASLYIELVRSQHFHAPSRTSFAFFENLLKELRRELTMAASASSTNPAAGAGVKDEAEPATSGHARQALSKLLDQLNTPSGKGAAGLSTGGSSAAGGVAGTGAHHSAATAVVRYASPIFSDIYAKQPLGQRGPGFGTLQRKTGHGGPAGGSTNTAFYTSYYPKAELNAQRPFRIPPAQQMQGGAVRLHFPRNEEWVSAQDMADIPQYASRGITDRDRKRAREGV